MINPAETVKHVNAVIVGEIGMVARDADGNDFGFAGATYDQALRFKTGTSTGEVAVQIFRGKHPAGVLRITSPASLDATLQTMKAMASDHVRKQA